MSYGLYMAAEGAQVQSKILEVLSNNLANVDTAGFKRDLAIAQARNSEAIERGLDSPGSGSINDIGGGVMVSQTATQFSSGPLKSTGIPTDMAIVGEGFYQIEKDGDKFLTRAGNFLLDVDGQLVTQEGHNVLSDGGSPIRLDTTQPWTVKEDGTIDQNGPIAKVGLFRPKSLGDLVKVGSTMFSSLSTPEAVPTEERNVRGGFLELSGVKPTEEMMELIKASRAFEVNVQMIRSQDGMMGNLISRVLGK